MNWWQTEKCFIIAEAGLNHNGDLENARDLIEIASDAGADCVKFQMRNVATLAAESHLDRPDNRFPSLGKTYREIREKHEFNVDEFRDLREFAESKGLVFMVTPFDIQSLDRLVNAGVENFKVASHGVTNYELLEALAKLGRPTVLSSGMSTEVELDTAVEKLSSRPDVLVGILHCVSAYPTPPTDLNLKLIDTIKARYRIRTGYSGHELGFLPTLLAVARGATIVERHFTRDNNQEGFDHHMSLNPESLREMIVSIRQVESMLGDGIKRVIDSELLARDKYRLSMVARRNLPVGTILESSDFEYRNPGTGIAPADSHSYIGHRLERAVTGGEMILPEDFGL